MPSRSPNSNSTLSICAAWLVHVFTSLGIVAGFFALLNTQEHDWQMAMTWLIIALVIDGVDGSLARFFEVKKHLSFMDGKNIDYVVDFVNYAFIPAYMFYEWSALSYEWTITLSCIILIISALYYGRTNMVTDDNYFIGFPVLWNMVMYYYIFISDFASYHYIWITILIAVLHFVPIKMAYPSQNERMKIPSLIVFIILMIIICLSIWLFPSQPLWLVISAYGVLAYFIMLMVWDTMRSRKVTL